MDNDMSVYQDEIRLRDELRQKSSREKLSEDEILWLETHREFSRICGAPFLKRDVILLEKSVPYQFHAELLETKHPDQIYPCFKAPRMIGDIRTDTELTDSRGKRSVGKPVKILAAMLQEKRPEFRFSYSSECGILLVYFFCFYYDQKQHFRTGRFSCDFEGLYMRREDVAPNGALYRCKAPYAENFDSLVFTLRWKRESD